jgi:putative membrane protein
MKTTESTVFRSAMIAAALAALPACLWAQMDATPGSTPAPADSSASSTTSAPNDPDLKHSDRTFFRKAAEGGMKEIAVSRAVMDHLTNPQVRDFAQTMIRDHTAAGAELALLAQNKGVTLPGPDAKLTEKWSQKENGADKDYIDEMVGDHQGVVKLFEKESKSGDPDLAAFAQKTLPTLQHHLEMAKSLQKAL